VTSFSFGADTAIQQTLCHLPPRPTLRRRRMRVSKCCRRPRECSEGHAL